MREACSGDVQVVVRSRSQRRWRAGLWLAIAGLGGCSAIAASDLGAGIGASCSTNSDCQASTCQAGICVKGCSGNLDCPSPSVCTLAGGATAGLCELPLSVELLHIGAGTADEGWSLTHQEGMAYAQQQLGYITGAAMAAGGVTWDYQNFVLDSDVGQKVADAVGRGAQVVFANSYSQRDAILKIAPQYVGSGVKFMTCAGYDVLPPNVGSYFGHLEQAWYVAGRTAAIRSGKSPPRLGFVASYVTPEVVRHLNAFMRGAQSYNPGSIVEVRWLGFWYDYNDTPTYSYKASFMAQAENLFGEELLTARLIESGCDVIAHQSDGQRPSKALDRWIGKGWLDPKTTPVYSLANDNQYGCYQPAAGGRGAAYLGCLGAVYWNWGPLYQRLLDQIHRNVWQPTNVVEAMSNNKTLSIVGFELSPGQGVDESALAQTIQTAANSGPDAVYRGPYATTGQRAPVAAGETIHYNPDDPNSSQEWRTMCWFVQGVKEKMDPGNPLSADQDARVPDGTLAVSTGTSGRILMSPPGAPTGTGLNCRENY